ncbi:hypothetical protein NL108_009358, partial [Boleophthalmus pectinirostris]
LDIVTPLFISAVLSSGISHWTHRGCVDWDDRQKQGGHLVVAGWDPGQQK